MKLAKDSINRSSQNCHNHIHCHLQRGVFELVFSLCPSQSVGWLVHTTTFGLPLFFSICLLKAMFLF